MPFEPASPQFRPGQQLTQAAMNRQQRDVHSTARDYAQNFRPHVGRNTGLPGFADSFVGVVRSGGPNGEADYTDARYWIDRAVPKGSLDVGDLFDTDVEKIPNVQEAVTATNLAELPPASTDGSPMTGGSHSLTVGTRVQVTRFRTREADGSAGVDQFVFAWAAGGMIPVRLTAGGASGTGTAPSSSEPTYTMKTLSGTVLATAVPYDSREPGVDVKPATRGTAVYDPADGGGGSAPSGTGTGTSSGVQPWVLWWCNEIPLGDDCADTGGGTSSGTGEGGEDGT